MVKAKLFRQNHTKKYKHSQKEKKEKNIYITIYRKQKEEENNQKSINKSTNDNKL